MRGKGEIECEPFLRAGVRGRRVLPQHGGRLLAEQRVARALVATQAVRRIPGMGQERQAWASGSG